MSPASNNITLLGMPGSGKSFVGQRLAERLEYAFVDTDSVMEQNAQQSLPAILATLGTESFLKTEEAAILDLQGDRLVISPGGSVIYSTKAVQHLRDISTIIFLDVSLATIERRIGSAPRGIVNADDKNLVDLFAERTPLYKEVAHYSVDGELEVDRIVDAILLFLKN